MTDDHLLGRLFGRKKVEIPPEDRPELFLQPSDPVPDFRLDHLDICFCGSKKYFKSCCGSKASKRPAPFGVHVIPDYLPRSTLDEINQYLDKQNSEALMVIDDALSTKDNIVTKLDEKRVSQRVHLGEMENKIKQIVKKAFVELVEKYYAREMDWFETPQVLRYFPGGFYHSHADSENLDIETACWHKVIDRDVSLLIYLNDDFEGGELSFDKFHYQLQPKAGMAVIFPSDHRYMHTAQTVYEGMRQAIVSWGSIKGIHKISKSLPEAAIQY